MKHLRNAVSFKSIPTMWELEESGNKANTIRMVTGEEWEWIKEERPEKIYIVCTDDQKDFVRTISHVMKVGEWLGQVQILISWRDEGRVHTCPMHQL